MTERLIENFTPLIILLDGGKTDVGEALYCECGTLCALNTHGATISGCGKLVDGDKVCIGEDIYRAVDGPLPECYVGEGWDDGKENARENECEHCMNERDLSKVEPKLPKFFEGLRGMFDGPTTAKYRWVITKDRIDGGASKGTEGPSNMDRAIKSNRAHFVIKDDDGNTYYEGDIYGEFDGFEPLSDYGTPNAGASAIFYNGEVL